MKMIKTFSREELYEEIWEISAKQVSLKYDLSYSDLLKKCKEFEIPIPNGSYWYRKNTEQDLSEFIVPLPQNDVNEVNIDRKSLKNSRIKAAKHKEDSTEDSTEDKKEDTVKLDTTRRTLLDYENQIVKTLDDNIKIPIILAKDLPFFIKKNLDTSKNCSPLSLKNTLLDNKVWFFDILLLKLKYFISNNKVLLLFFLISLIFYSVSTTSVSYISFRFLK